MNPLLQDKRYPKSFGSVPTAMGTITRLACTRLKEAGLSPEPLLAQAGLTVEQIKDRRARVSVEVKSGSSIWRQTLSMTSFSVSISLKLAI